MLAIFAAAVCLVGIFLFFSQFYRGIGQCIALLKDIFRATDQEVNYLDEYRLTYSVLVVLTLFITFCVLLTSYLHSDARYEQDPMCPLCESKLPAIIVSGKRIYYYSLKRFDNFFLANIHLIHTDTRVDMGIL